MNVLPEFDMEALADECARGNVTYISASFTLFRELLVRLESGQPFKILTKRHLAHYGLTPEQYREKWGYPKNTPLVCKALQRERRKKMQDMKLWEKRTKGAAPAEA